MTYYLAPSLEALRDEIDERWPNRDKTSDGWIGDASHSARKSDHNPDWSDGGVVRAIDVDEDGINVKEVLDSVVGDPRVEYVIYEMKIASRTYGPWTWRSYSGSNPHDKHMHISIRHTDFAENSTERWLDQQEEDDMPYGDWSEKDKTEQAERFVDALLNRKIKEVGADKPDKKVISLLTETHFRAGNAWDAAKNALSTLRKK